MLFVALFDIVKVCVNCTRLSLEKLKSWGDELTLGQQQTRVH